MRASAPDPCLPRREPNCGRLRVGWPRRKETRLECHTQSSVLLPLRCSLCSSTRPSPAGCVGFGAEIAPPAAKQYPRIAHTHTRTHRARKFYGRLADCFTTFYPTAFSKDHRPGLMKKGFDKSSSPLTKPHGHFSRMIIQDASVARRCFCDCRQVQLSRQLRTQTQVELHVAVLNTRRWVQSTILRFLLPSHDNTASSACERSDRTNVLEVVQLREHLLDFSASPLQHNNLLQRD